MSTEELRLVAAKLLLGLTSAEDLPSAAIKALESGLESPSLWSLAGLARTETDEARHFFACVLSEFDLGQMSQRDAVEILARAAAAEILDGTATPFQGAERISQLSLYLPDESHSAYDSFIYAASEWEDRPEDRPLFEACIIEAARKLLQ